jgi:Zn-dependent protease with chaperone function
MQVLVLALVATVIVPSAMPMPREIPPTGTVLAVAFGPAAMIAAAAWLASRIAMRGVHAGRGSAPQLLRIRLRGLQWSAVVAQAVAVIGFGWLDWVRNEIGDWPLLDELIALSPPIAAIAACWWAAHPMERLLRGDSASRSRYVITELRNQLGMIGGPALLAIGASEAASLLSAGWFGEASIAARLAAPAAVLAVMLVAPSLMVRILDTEPMPDDVSREVLERVLSDNGVRMSRILVWRTGGVLLNGAVLGFIPAARYLLLTDAVLERMPIESLRAIVAHEVGHVKRRHVPWLLLTTLATVAAAVVVVDAATPIAADMFAPPPVDPELLAAAGLDAGADDALGFIEVGGAIAVLAMVLPIFGWISRRFEQQADAFASQYLSVVGPSSAPSFVGAGLERRLKAPEAAMVTPRAVLAMCRALGRVAELNGVSPAAPSWRHGSIRWRQRNLVQLVSQPILSLPIDRKVRWIKLTGTVVLLACAVIEFARGFSAG